MLKTSLFIALCLSCVIAMDVTANVHQHDKVVVCYVASWAAYRPGNGAFTWENIDPTLCTHIIYSFAGLDNETYEMKSLDPFLDLEKDGGKGQFSKIINLKAKQPDLKVTVAIGGWNEGSEKYSAMAMTPQSRRKFIDSALNFTRTNGFDGLDMDWEYPGSRNGRPEDRANFVSLLQELRQEFDKYGLLLTAALGAAQKTIDIGYDIPAISKSLDFLHIMCYDYHGSWDTQTGHNAPLRLPAGNNLAPHLRLSVEDTVKYYIEQGADARKIVLGIPFYGRTFTLQDINLHDKGAMTKGTGFQGPYTREAGFYGYNEICTELKTQTDDLWTEVWDKDASVPYIYNGNRWISYDDHRSIEKKVRFAYDKGLAGAMVWAIDNDDFQAECSPTRYPLLRTISSEFKMAADSPTATTVIPTTSVPPQTGKASTVTAISFHLLLISIFVTRI